MANCMTSSWVCDILPTCKIEYIGRWPTCQYDALLWIEIEEESYKLKRKSSPHIALLWKGSQTPTTTLGNTKSPMKFSCTSGLPEPAGYS